MRKDIENIDDVKCFVDRFYGRVRQDDLLSPIFNEILKGLWPQHLEKMYRFWQTILLGEHTYKGYPFQPHAQLPVYAEHFERWLSLFYETLDADFEGENVYEAKRHASKMAALFQMRIEHKKITDSVH